MLDKLTKVIRNPASLGERALNASLWNVAGLGMRYPIRLAGNLIMARLVAPEAFGLMATVTALHIGLSLISEVGFTQSVMRSERGEQPRFLRVVWTVQILRGAALTLVMLLLALAVLFLGPVYAGANTVYADPRLPGLMCIAAIAILARGLESTTVLLARRRMRLARVKLSELISQAAGVGAMIGIGLLYPSVWALVAGLAVRAVTRAVLSHMIFPGPRMALRWDPTEMYELWSFGKWMIIASIGGYFAAYSDRLIFGALIDKELFGLYAIAMVWVELGVQVLQMIGGSVFIPAFSAVMRENPKRIGPAFRKALWAFGCLTFAIFSALYFLGGWVIELLYPAAYLDARLLLPYLAFRLVMLMFIPLREYIVSTGDSRYAALGQSVAGISAVASICIAYELFGFEAAILAFALSAVPAVALQMLYPPLRPLVPHAWVALALCYPLALGIWASLS